MFGHQERVAILLLIAVAIAVIAAHVMLVQIGKEPFASAYTDQSADGNACPHIGHHRSGDRSQKWRACAAHHR